MLLWHRVIGSRILVQIESVVAWKKLIKKKTLFFSCNCEFFGPPWTWHICQTQQSHNFILTCNQSVMNRFLYSPTARSSMRRFFSAKTRTNGLKISKPGATSFAGLSPLWRPFGPLADEILGSRFTDEFDESSLSRFSRVADEAPMDCKESHKDFQIQINLPGTLNSFFIHNSEAPMDCKESHKDFQLQINLPGT